MLRVLFILRDLHTAEPLGVMYLAAMLRRAGFPVRLLPTRGIDLLAEVRRFDPQVIGYSVCTGQQRYLLALNRRLKRDHRFFAIFGGPHPTFFPEMAGEEGVDAICRGEGELAMLDLCRAIDEGRDVSAIPNLCMKVDGRMVNNPVRPLVANLDELPFPDREARFEADPAARQYAAQSFLTSRGCPYSCAYCFNPSMQALYGPAWGRRRIRSPDNVIAEIEAARGQSALAFVQFRCSMFPCERGWLEEFAALYRRRIGLPFYCHVRADQISDEVAGLLASAGCRSVNMGIECADERYRAEVLRRPMSNDTIRQACRRLRSRGVAILADNILGLPGRTLEDDLGTLAFNIECGIDYPLAMLLQPYPGTAIDDYARRIGAFDGDYGGIEANYYFRSPLKFCSEREKRQIENLQKLFALGVEAPWLAPVIRRLIRLPANLVFNSLFRCWLMWCYQTRIIPHRLTSKEAMEILAGVFGIYAREAFHEADA